jgi:hypothetical protein
MELSSEQKLKAAIKTEIEKDATLPDRDIAASVIRAEPAAFADWALGKLAALARLQRGRKLPDPAQLAFPFHDLSIQIRVKEGTVELRGATLGLLRQADKVLAKRKRAGIEAPPANSLHGRIRREIEIMEPYAYASRKITVEKVHELVAAGVPAPTVHTGMSDAMRRYWENKSPAERSAIARRRQAKRRRKGKEANG